MKHQKQKTVNSRIHSSAITSESKRPKSAQTPSTESVGLATYYINGITVVICLQTSSFGCRVTFTTSQRMVMRIAKIEWLKNYVFLHL